ncbi:hypothetical protein M2390_003144 [Mycetocola sp. BIGb0189]|nr:hypothetical protein [Mycetocola sp. BIGb0189]
MDRLLSSDRDFARFLATRDPVKVAAERPLPAALDPNRRLTPAEAVALWPSPSDARRIEAQIAAYTARKSQTVPKSSGGLFHTQNAPTGADRSL